MKSYKVLLLLLVALTLFSCKDEENPAEVTLIFSGTDNWNTVRNGEYLKVNVSVDFDKSSPGLEVKNLECFFGNRKIASSKDAKYEIYFQIEDAPTGIHELKVEVTATAPGFDKTIAAGCYDINVTN